MRLKSFVGEKDGPIVDLHLFVCAIRSARPLQPVALHAAAEHGAFEDVERGEQRRGAPGSSPGQAVADVIVRLCGGMAPGERQRGPRSLHRLDLALLVDRQDARMGGRVHGFM